MEDRRNETAPAWLVALAAAALGMSWAVTRQWAAPPVRAEVERPSRTVEPLRWPLAELKPLPPAQLPKAQLEEFSPKLLPSCVTLRIASPFEISQRASDPALATGVKPWVTAPLQWRLASDHAFTNSDTAPLGPALAAPVDFANRLIVLVPAEPKWRAGDVGRRVVTARMRRDWSLGSIDTVAAVRAVGRLLANPGELLDPMSRTSDGFLASLRMGGGSRVANRLTVRPLDVVAPKLMAPVTPARSAILRAVAKPSQQNAMPTIADYLARSAAGGAFPLPVSIGDQLDRVAVAREQAPWAWAVAYRLRTLAATPVNGLSAHRTIVALDEASREAFTQAEAIADARLAAELRRAGYALSRRVVTWRAEQALTIAAMQRPATSDPLAGVRWAMSSRGLGMAPGMLLADAEGVAAEPPSLIVARRVEAYEAAPTARLARLLAADAARFNTGAEGDAQAVARSIDASYRNANLRVAIASELIQRMLPQPETVTAPVSDRIAGAPVHGRSTTRTELAVRLVEDPLAWRLGLEAHGMVTAQTYSRGGPALVSSRGATSFVAKKLVVLTPEGLQAAPSIATAKNESQRLVSLKTSYDAVPLLGNYVRSAARTEYGRLRTRAKAETRVKVERRVTQTFDTQVTPQLERAEERFASDVTSRATALGLQIDPIELRTTDRRLITRVRVASESQLAAHTPRMRAPSDSWLSVQVHESTLNNALDGLQLAGATMTPAELRERLVERLRLSPQTAPNEEALLRFASEQPIRIDLEEGRAHLTLSFDEITVRGRRYQDFKVHAFYRPAVNGLVAELVQEGVPQIEGRMRNSSRMHLHGVMGKVLGESRRLALVQVTEATPEQVAAALAGLVTNQLVIEDGWLGLAIGPQRPAGSLAVQVGSYVR